VFGVPALEGAAAGGVGGARLAGVVDGICGWGAGGVSGFQAAAQLGPGMAAGPRAWWVGALLVEVGIQGTMAGLGEAPVGLPHPHQCPHEVTAATPGLERRVGMAGAEPDADAVAEPDLLGASVGAVKADRAHPGFG
jgi:hypothetical protein